MTLPGNNNQKLSKHFGKWPEKLVYLNEYKTKIKNKNSTNECRYFLESNFLGVMSNPFILM